MNGVLTVWSGGFSELNISSSKESSFKFIVGLFLIQLYMKSSYNVFNVSCDWENYPTDIF